MLGTDNSSADSPARAGYTQALCANFPVAVSMSCRLCFAAAEKRVPFSGGRVRENGSTGLNMSKLLRGADFRNSPPRFGREPGEVCGWPRGHWFVHKDGPGVRFQTKSDGRESTPSGSQSPNMLICKGIRDSSEESEKEEPRGRLPSIAVGQPLPRGRRRPAGWSDAGRLRAGQVSRRLCSQRSLFSTSETERASHQARTANLS